LRVHAAPLNWTEIRGLVKGSYQMVAAKKPLKKRLGRSKSKSSQADID
jgi:hypothetical protein